jgi:hypothetical protein
MASARCRSLELVDLPRAILDVVLRHLDRPFDRLSAALTCRELRAVYDACPFDRLALSMQAVLGRGRYEDVPWWTYDFHTLRALLRTPKMSQLTQLELWVDTACFEGSDVRLPCSGLSMPTLQVLCLVVCRKNYAYVTTGALVTLLRCAPRLESFHCKGLARISRRVLEATCTLRGLESISFCECRLTADGARFLRTRALSASAWDARLWPPKLRLLRLDFVQWGSGRATRLQLDARDVRFPPTEALDLSRTMRYALRRYEFADALFASTRCLIIFRRDLFSSDMMEMVLHLAGRYGTRMKLT